MATVHDRDSEQEPREIGFEEIYRRAGDDLSAIPWAALAPQPELVAWLDGDDSPTPGGSALVVGCGLGDDAEELARRGWDTSAFDLSPTAIARCAERFPDSAVDYRVADLFALPAEWERAFDLTIEIRTLQSLPPARREPATAAIAGVVGPAGVLWVRCYGRLPGEPIPGPPWPVSPDELAGFERSGLAQRSFEQEGELGRRQFTVSYRSRVGT